MRHDDNDMISSALRHGDRTQVIRDELDRLGTLGSSNVILRHEMSISDQFNINDRKRRWGHTI